MLSLKVGESKIVEIVASRYWNHTKIFLEVENHYRLEVQGKQFWYDARKKVDADGTTYPELKWAEWMRRMPNEEWFTLIGAINQLDKNEFFIAQRFPIGKQTQKPYSPSVSGELVCYANDVPFMYWNNHGSIFLTIARIK